MPKRTREDDTKPALRLSALAQRRLHAKSQESAPVVPAPVVPVTKLKKTKLAEHKRHKEAITPTESVSNDELAWRRAEIEKKLRGQVTDDPAYSRVTGSWSAAQNSHQGKKTPPSMDKPSPAGKSEESALARIKRERAKESAGDDEGVEMKSAGRSDEDETMDFEAESATPRLFQISSLVPTEENYIATGSKVTCRLQPGETLVLVGIYQLTVMRGSITIYGATLSETSPTQTIYAPMTHALPVIKAPSSKRKNTGENSGPEVQITSHHSSLLNIGSYCPTFNGIWGGSSNPTSHSFSPIFTSTTNIPLLDISASWKPTLASLVSAAAISDNTTPPIILITGSKGTGKSTFSRILVNQLLSVTSTLTYLDIDPGQPEFSAPSIISLTTLTTPLLGPPFTPRPTPIRAHHTGYISPRDDPTHYIACIGNLLSHHPPTTPLLINTAGWTKGLGLELLAELALLSAPTHIIHLHHHLHSASPPLSDSTSLPSPVPATTTPRFSPQDLRALSQLCYFHGGSDFATPLTAVAPWCVRRPRIRILGDVDVGVDVRAAVEGTVVGVVVEEEGREGRELAPERTECIGLAIVRLLDAAGEEAQLVTPVAGEEVARREAAGGRVVLVRGRLELSVWEMMLPAGVVPTGEVPWVSTGVSEKSSGAVWRVRRNVMRRGQQ